MDDLEHNKSIIEQLTPLSVANNLLITWVVIYHYYNQYLIKLVNRVSAFTLLLRYERRGYVYRLGYVFCS